MQTANIDGTALVTLCAAAIDNFENTHTECKG